MFVTKSSDIRILAAVRVSNEIQDDVIGDLANCDGIPKCSSIGWREIAALLDRHKDEDVEVRTYWYWSSRVNGKYDARYPNIIWINTRSRIINSVPSLCSLFFHEDVHRVDAKYDRWHFHHDSNYYYEWKEDTAPFKVDWLAELHARRDEPTAPRDKATKVKIYTPIWKRVWNYFF